MQDADSGDPLPVSRRQNTYFNFSYYFPYCGWCPTNGVTGIFSRGGKLTFPNFFFTAWFMLCPSKNCPFCILVDPNKFQWFQKKKSEKQTNRKKKGGVLCTFSYFFFFTFLFSNFDLFPSKFPSFLSIFPFFLVLLFPVGQQKFPGEKCGGGALCLLPVIVMPLCPSPYLLRKKVWIPPYHEEN